MNELNWNQIDELITAGTCKVSVLCKELNVKSADLKKAIQEHYGDRIEFRRGRNGGVYWSN